MTLIVAERYPHTLHLADLPARLAGQITPAPGPGCWIWRGRLDKDGYGRHGGRGVHRIVWEILRGPVPVGLVLDHREDWGCTSRACCWPGHLLPVTPRVNILRGRSFSAVNAAKIACDHGHPYSPDNTYRWHGRRDCRVCIRDRVRRYQAVHRPPRTGLSEAA